jgi:hypothetical protein
MTNFAFLRLKPKILGCEFYRPPSPPATGLLLKQASCWGSRARCLPHNRVRRDCDLSRNAVKKISAFRA